MVKLMSQFWKGKEHLFTDLSIEGRQNNNWHSVEGENTLFVSMPESDCQIHHNGIYYI